MRENPMRSARRFENGGGIMNPKNNERLILAGQMPLRAPNGEVLSSVPVYKIVSVDCPDGEQLKPNERLVFVGTEESKAAAEERFNAIVAGKKPPKSSATKLYIKEPANNPSDDSGLTEGEKRVLEPLIDDLLDIFSAAMQEREALERQRSAVNRK